MLPLPQWPESAVKHFLIAFGLLLGARSAAAVELPTAGSQLQQIPSAAPALTAASTPLALPAAQAETAPASAATPAAGARFVVKELRVTDARAFSQQELVAATGFRAGSETSLAELQRFATEISGHYREAGYFLAQAIVPAQDVIDGVVTIAVHEGRYGDIELRNSSRLSDEVARRLLGGLHAGDLVAIRPLEARLLRLADVPGVLVKSTLAPGTASGASNLIVEVMPGRRVTGSLDADNSGSRHTGRNRLGGTLHVNNLAGHGDVATLRALSAGDGLAYGYAGYQMQLGRAHAGVGYTALDYELGGQFSPLDAHGTARIASVYLSHSLLRQRATSLTAALALDSKRFEDIIEVTEPATTTRKRARAASLSLSAEHHDDLAGGGVSTYSFDWTSGTLDIDSAAALAADAASARSDGHYDKLGLRVQRLQRVTDTLTLYARLQGQLAGRNLDVSEKMSLGGAGAVRAYPEGEAYVDQGYLLSVEARVPVGRLLPRLPGTLQWVTFLESATGSLNRDPWTAERNRRSLSGGGAGLAFQEPHGLRLEAYYAHTLGGTAGTSTPDGDGRVWLSASQNF